MPPSPVLRTSRLRLEPFAEPHLTERYVGWLNDPDVVRFSEQRHRRHTLASCEAYWRSFEGTPNHFWAIVADDASLGHIGNINTGMLCIMEQCGMQPDGVRSAHLVVDGEPVDMIHMALFNPGSHLNCRTPYARRTADNDRA